MKSEQIAAWQREYWSGPKVWWVEDKDGNATNYYESEEAANFEVDFYRRHKTRGYSLRSMPIHSLTLARDRWGDTSGSSPGGGAAQAQKGGTT